MSSELYEWRVLLGTTIAVPCENSLTESPFIYNRQVGNRILEINLTDRIPRCRNLAQNLLTIKLPHKQERGFELCNQCQKALLRWAGSEGRDLLSAPLSVKPVTQEEAAALVGVVLNTWSRWEMSNPVENPIMLRRALVQLAIERGIKLENYPARSLRARLDALKQAAASHSTAHSTLHALKKPRASSASA